ncbi:YrbE family protein [Gordonia hirsuta DSM 44140 = NBRC 16056]|uniref:YrbE family protein n=1 Tax=Gordonia hirsuta DSM 44140 = NBRC 16056 TaxID=1121927 RepID=L7LB94_9ACTN|nr:ABC transporter permease [Gordonia hirsuta]GAC58405.1 YrbE family protein [Gordonia hirsuta DSM 44140 = NBRC 16056]
MGIPSTYAAGRLGVLWRLGERISDALAVVGHFLTFCTVTFARIPSALLTYRRQTIRTVTDLMWGRGALIVGGGTAMVMAVLGFAAGGTVAIVSHGTLSMLGMGPVSGAVSSFAITREFAPLLAGVAFAVQAGCRMTAEIGSMRISEEIDALEVVGVRSISFVVSTRMIAGLLTTIPMFLICVVASYLSAAWIVALQGESSGAYRHYFDQFAAPADLLFALIKVAVFVLAVTLIHCYRGYFATGGPESVGTASGRAIRASLVTIGVLDLLMTVLFWGISSPFVFRG